MAEHANSTLAPTRRSLLAVATAATLLPPRQHDEAAQFIDWERQIAALDARAARPGTSEKKIDEIQARRADFEVLIGQTPATQRASFAVKARLLASDRRFDLDPFGEDIAVQLARYLENL